MKFTTRQYRWLLVLYGIALTIATHWPDLSIQSPIIERPDLLLHGGCFGLLTLLIISARLVGKSADNSHNLFWGIVIAVAWSGLDELSQGIPAVHRHVAWSDFGANLLGVFITGIGVWIFILRKKVKRQANN